jgi:hypothetical protein
MGVEVTLFSADPEEAVGVGVVPMLTGEFDEQAETKTAVRIITDIKRLT